MERNFSLDCKGHVVVAYVSLTKKNQVNDASKRLHPCILSCTQWTVSFQLGVAAEKKRTFRNCYMRKVLYLKTVKMSNTCILRIIFYFGTFCILAALMAHIVGTSKKSTALLRVHFHHLSKKKNPPPAGPKHSTDLLTLLFHDIYSIFIEFDSSSAHAHPHSSIMCTIRAWKVSGTPPSTLHTRAG